MEVSVIPPPVRYGLWGGRAPGGWCTFASSLGGDRLGYSTSGTQADAEAGREVFVSENANRSDLHYEVVVFDPAREPAADEVAVPTKAQAVFLQELKRIGDYNRAARSARSGLPNVRSATLEAVDRRGWTFGYPEGHDMQIRVTPAGMRALERYAMKGQKR